MNSVSARASIAATPVLRSIGRATLKASSNESPTNTPGSSLRRPGPSCVSRPPWSTARWKGNTRSIWPGMSDTVMQAQLEVDSDASSTGGAASSRMWNTSWPNSARDFTCSTSTCR